MSLDDPITRREAIGWALTTPVLMLALVSCYGTWGFVAQIDKRAGYVDAPLEVATRVLIALGDVGVAAAYFLLAVAPMLVLLSRRRTRLALVTPVLCGVLCLALNYQIAHSAVTTLERAVERIGVDGR